jgi:hypothetical protein
MSFIILGLLMQIYFQPKMLSLQAFVAHESWITCPLYFPFVLTLYFLF